ncbi:MAG: class IV adenylate cyclase [Planctomycetaceae bacterium]|nr:class IV adenylate cyclase [Planctomycetaceae bacterium]
MQYEVEVKYPVTDLQTLENRLRDLGSAISPPHSEIDVYFAHPARDFAKTDEALRLRRKGDQFFITYKGPKIDATTKTRHEIELPLLADDPGFRSWFSLLEALGFAAVGEVRKSRRKVNIRWQDRTVEGSLDQVEHVGAYVELELIADADDVEPARACLLSLAKHLGLTQTERRSYLELLLNASRSH